MKSHMRRLGKYDIYLLLFLILYITIYFVIFISKYALWGSDILYLTRISQHLYFKDFISPQLGYPQGMPLFLALESKMSGISVYTMAKIHIAIVYALLIFLTFLIAQKMFHKIKISVLASFIVASVYPRATLMSPQYGQAVNLALLLVLSSLISLMIGEKKHRFIFFVLSIILVSPVLIIHRPSTVIISLMFLVYVSYQIFLNKKISRRKKLIILITSLILLTFFGVVAYKIYSQQIERYISNILLSKEYMETHQPAPYENGYFMSYIGWELIPLFAVSLLFFKKYWNKLNRSFIALSLVVMAIAILYVAGFVVLGISVSWRAANYSLYVVAIFVSCILYYFINKSFKSKKWSYFLYGIVASSALLYPLDEPIQKYIYRAVTGTTPERIRIPFFGGEYAPYIIYGIILITLVIAGVLLLLANKNKIKSSKLKKIVNKKTVIVLLIIILLLPRIVIGITWFYLIPPDVTDSQYRAFNYIKTHYPEAGIVSDPQTVYFAVGYGLHINYVFGSYIVKDTAPLYGPSSKGSTIAGWARTFDKWIKNKDIDSLYNFMKRSNDTILIIDIYGGKLVDMNINPPHGGYAHMPGVLMDFKKAVDESGKFTLIYSQNYGDEIYIYMLVYIPGVNK